MKIQGLAIIFVIIILPITLIIGEYASAQIQTFKIEQQYDSRLITATDDALKAFQINTFNDATSDIADSKINSIEASVNAFYNSMELSFGLEGYSKEDLQLYVPAIVYTMYDGYYIYSPYTNIVPDPKTGESQGVEINLNSSNIDYGFKPYVYYSCRYKIGEYTDFIINYALDNYITVQGMVDGESVYKSGYLLTIANSQNSEGVYKKKLTDGVIEYYYNGQKIEPEENLTENLVEKDSSTGKIITKAYKYIKLNGTKYYWDEDEEYIFYLMGENRVKQVTKAGNQDTYIKYVDKIKTNSSAIHYYESAYEFTKWVNEKLSNLETKHAVTQVQNSGAGKIFKNEQIEYPSSNFNLHRKEVIRQAIESNLSVAIANFNNYTKSGTNFQMPKLKETEWEMLQNEVSIISFLQGLNIGGKVYNGYTVVANNKTKEVVKEERIYISTNDGYYHKINDRHFEEKYEVESVLGGFLDLDFQVRKDGATGLSYINRNELGCYTSIVGQEKVNNKYDSIYEYLQKTDLEDGIKQTYYTALARERWGAYKVENPSTITAILERMEIDPQEGIGSSNGLTASDITAEDYGAYVTNYASSDSAAQQSVGWRIFHSDGENIYLIADNYVETQYIPAGKGSTAINTSTSDSLAQGFGLTPANDYAGWSDLSSNSIATKWLSKYAASTYTSTNNNMKATAYLLDTSVWNPVFVNSNYAEYAIGGPTLELFTASYNATHQDKTIDTQVTSSVGYLVKWSTGTSYTSYINGLNITEDLYIINDTTNASGMWFASPSGSSDNVMSAGSDGYVRYVKYNGQLGFNGFSCPIGARPLVSLKSNIQIEKQSDGTYIILDPSEDTWSKTKEVEVHISDQHSGLATGAKVQYGWSTSNETQPTEWKDLTLTGYTPGANSVTFMAQATEEDALTGKYYLWVKPVDVKDMALETANAIATDDINNWRKSETQYLLDNTAPTITLGVEGNSTWMNNVLVGVKIKDEHSGLNTGASLQYGWSLSNTEEPTEWETINLTNYSAGTTQEITFTASSNGLTGKYYLWVKPTNLSDMSEEGGNIPKTKISTGTFCLDNTAPTIVILDDGTTEDDATWHKSVNVTIEMTDEHSGLNTDSNIQYGWSTSEITAPETWISASVLTYEAGANTTSFEATAAGLTGEYYLWVKAITLGDIVGNYIEENTTTALANKYYLDNTAPTINTMDTQAHIWSKTKDIDVKIVDQHSGLAEGAKLQYGWSTSASTEPTNWKGITLSGYSAGDKAANFTAQATEEDALTGKYYLWVKPVDVKDIVKEDANVQNTTEISESEYLLDNTAPTITLGAQGSESWLKELSVGVQIRDEHSGLATGASLQYAWSLSNTEVPTEWTTITPTEYIAGTTDNVTLTANSGNLTGKYYLWVKPVNVVDISIEGGNTQGTTIVSTGTFNLDNTTPTISIQNDTEDAEKTWYKSVSVSVEIKDEHSGLDLGPEVQYGWSTSKTTDPEVWTTIIPSGYSEGTQSATIIVASAGLTGEYYLWLKPISLADVAGNYITETEATSSNKKFYLDNTAPEIIIDTFTASTITADNYGGYVTNYASSDSAAQQSVGWRIFHSDGENIYLIADSYIENKYKPAGKGGTNYSASSGIYGADLMALGNYAGTSDIASNFKTKWLSQYIYESTDGNAKATAYLLDTSVWNTNFANSYADYAIGGATLELFTASYNANHEKDIEVQADATGYKVKWSTDADYAYSIRGLDTTESLYVISNTYEDTVYGMLLASPSAIASGSLMGINYAGGVGYYGFNYESVGTRPIVALKSNIHLEKKSDGTYTIEDTWSQTKEVEVEIRDEHAGLAEGATLQYGWSTSKETEPTEWKEIQVTGYVAGANRATFIAEATKEDALTGKYHLWVRPINLKDISIEGGNSAEQDYLEKSEGTYWLDNTAPTIGSISAIGSSESTFNLEISGIADNVGVSEQSGPKGYYVSTSSQAPTENSEWILSGESSVTFEGAQETTTYYIWEIDNANNISEAKTFTTNVINYAVENSSWYETFAEAVAGATSGNTIKVVKNVTETTNGTINKNIILNLNAKTLTIDQNSIKVNSGVTLEVNGNGKLETTSISNPVIETAGTLTLKQVTINGNSTAVIKSANGGNINIDGATLNGNIYTGSGTTNVNSGTINGDIYGGDNNSLLTGNTTININGGTINGNIYGGPRDNVLNGNATINIGKSATGNADSAATTLTITGNIYGGGNKPEETGYSVQTLTGTSTIKIDGTGYTTFNLSGSIFGSGKQSTVGAANIAIQNLGTASAPHIIQSIQRANTLTIDNSNVEIIGIADSSNASQETQFTLNRIGNLKIKNGTTMHLRRGFNQVEELNSLVDVNGTETKAAVAIENGALASSNVTNRIYVYQGINLIIAKEEYKPNEQLSNYGSVNGMTFFGMYARDRKTDALKYDIYDTTSPTNGNLFALGSYVEGVYNSNENAKTTDGFYTNIVDEETSAIVTDYIEITPYEQTYQDWILGLKTYTQEVTMTANRDKNKVYQSIPFDYFTQAGSSYNITLFSVNSLEKDINLIDKTQVPTIAATSAEANTNFALTMNNAQEGWKTKGETSFYTSETTPKKGTMQYITDDTGKIPYFDLYLHNSLNITKTSDCGLVNIVFMVKQTTNATSGQTRTFKVAITINLRTEAESDLAEFTTETQITKGKNYGLFSGSEVHITGRSQMTLYTNIYPLGTYAASDYRVLTTTCELPLNTEITMIDYAQGEQPVIYHYIIKDGYDALGSGTYMYNLSNFKLMGTTSETAKYANPNSVYTAQCYEEYRFIFDFKNATIDNDLLKQTIKLEIRDGENSTLKNREETKATFNIYKTQNSVLTLQLTENEENITQIIEQGKLTFNVVSDITKQASGATTIHDTYYDDKKLGMSISIYDSEKNRVSYEKLAGTYFVIDGKEYYPDMTGTTRICLADNVVKVSKDIEANIDAKLLSTGNYTIKVETFASANGTHYGLSGEKHEDIAISTLDITSGLQVEITDADKVIDASTGKTSEGDNIIKANIKASNIAEDTNIRMKLYKRNDTFNTDLTYADVSYTHVNLQDYVSTSLTKVENSVSDYEYLVTDEVGSETTISLDLALNQNLPTGGYKLVFEIYSGDTCIGIVERHLVAADLAN